MRSVDKVRRYLLREEARRLVAEMLSYLRAEAQVIKHRLTKSHVAYELGHSPSADQVNLSKYREWQTVLYTMQATSRHRLAPRWAQPDPRGTATKQQLLKVQAEWVEYQMIGQDYSEWSQQNFWFYRVQCEMPVQLALYWYGVRTGDRYKSPFLFCEVWDALLSPVTDPAAREAAVRLGGRRQGPSDYPTYHPW